MDVSADKLSAVHVAIPPQGFHKRQHQFHRQDNPTNAHSPLHAHCLHLRYVDTYVVHNTLVESEMVESVPCHLPVATSCRSTQYQFKIHSWHTYHAAKTDMEDVEKPEAHRPQEQRIHTYEARYALNNRRP